MITSTLLRTYRSQLIWFLSSVAGVVIVVEVITGPAWVAEVIGGGFWTLVVGSATKYWLAIMALIMVPLQLRAFIANGVTRRAFIAGASGFALVLAVFLAVVVVVGRVVENAVVAASTDLDRLSFGQAAGAFARDLPALLVAAQAGLLIGLLALRFRPLVTALLVVLAVAVAAGLLWLLGEAYINAPLPVPMVVSVPVSLVVVVLGYFGLQRLAAGTAIRPAAA